MARKSLRPHLNQIRSWVRQGRTDAWIAHQLEVPVQEIIQFREQNDLTAEEEPGPGAVAFPEEFDLRAEDDALIAAELEAAAREAAAREAERDEALAEEARAAHSLAREEVKTEEEGEEKKEPPPPQKRAKGSGKKRGKEDEGESGLPAEELSEEEDERGERSRRRGRRGGRKRRSGERAGTPIEGTFDHGEEGYGLWLDPAVQDDPIYAEHWAGHRPVEVTIEEDQMVIRRIRED